MSNKTAFYDRFVDRHIGPNHQETQEMLNVIGVSSLDQLIDETVPATIRRQGDLNLPVAQSEFEYLRELKEVADMNKVFKTYIGQGYYGTITPSVILRNIFQNPGWYTQYTPYQAEISQGRLEAILNFQTMVSDLTGFPISNGSLLDEATAAAEAMAMFFNVKNKKTKGDPANIFYVDENVLDATIDVLLTRAKPMNIEVVVGDWKTFANVENCLQPNSRTAMLVSTSRQLDYGQCCTPFAPLCPFEIIEMLYSRVEN